jgi:hypothetical protein
MVETLSCCPEKPVNSDRLWLEQVDEPLVERLIAAMQSSVAQVTSDRKDEAGWIEVPAPELAVALISILASVIEPAPDCRTPMGMRRAAEAAGKELLRLTREVRRLKEAELNAGTTTY